MPHVTYQFESIERIRLGNSLVLLPWQDTFGLRICGGLVKSALVIYLLLLFLILRFMINYLLENVGYLLR